MLPRGPLSDRRIVPLSDRSSLPAAIHGSSALWKVGSGRLERAMGIEPTTYSLGSCRSTTELRPRYQVLGPPPGDHLAWIWHEPSRPTYAALMSYDKESRPASWAASSASLALGRIGIESSQSLFRSAQRASRRGRLRLFCHREGYLSGCGT